MVAASAVAEAAEVAAGAGAAITRADDEDEGIDDDVGAERGSEGGGRGGGDGRDGRGLRGSDVRSKTRRLLLACEYHGVLESCPPSPSLELILQLGQVSRPRIFGGCAE